MEELFTKDELHSINRRADGISCDKSKPRRVRNAYFALGQQAVTCLDKQTRTAKEEFKENLGIVIGVFAILILFILLGFGVWGVIKVIAG